MHAQSEFVDSQTFFLWFLLDCCGLSGFGNDAFLRFRLDSLSFLLCGLCFCGLFDMGRRPEGTRRGVRCGGEARDDGARCGLGYGRSSSDESEGKSR